MSNQESHIPVIATTARILTKESQPISMADDPINYEYYVEQMRYDPADAPESEAFDRASLSIGRSRDFFRDFGNGRELHISVALLNESGGLVKPFESGELGGEPGEREIGLIDIDADSYHLHKTRMQKIGHKALGAHLGFSAHILDSDRLYINRLSIGNACKTCPTPNGLKAELQVLNQLGLTRFFEESGMASELIDKKYGAIDIAKRERPLDEEETASVMQYLIKAFNSIDRFV